MRLLFILTLLLTPVVLPAQLPDSSGLADSRGHPNTFFTSSEIAQIKKSFSKSNLFSHSFQETKKDVDAWLEKDVDVPFPKDPAGGYTHDRHKANYMLMFNSGVLFHLTGDNRYAKLVKKMFLKYALLNPTLKNHPQATSSSPGRLFWQALNDANWLVYSGMAYDLIRNSLSPAEREIIEEGAFQPEVDFITKDLQPWFDLIHNHGVWACAGVGIVGIATGNKDYVDMALYGTKKDGKSGFIAQMDGLFAPDGYYAEGPYYVRYAILPYYLFANALAHARPGLKIFEYRDRILLKALMAGLQQTNLDGGFFPLNDALKEKDYTSNELVTAVDIAYAVYKEDNGLLIVAKKQGRVILNLGGLAIANAIEKTKLPDYFPYRSVEYSDGMKGDEGGVSLLRNSKNEDLTTLIYKYTSHGLSHGHYDKLNYQLYDKGNEILTDYGAVRFIGVEQKFGGRYLPESKAFAAQTIAHNTIVVDEKSHFDGKEAEAEKFHAEKLFSSIGNPLAQVVIAKEENAYKGVKLQRSVYLLQLTGGRKFLVDIFNVRSRDEHQYDLPFHFNGHLISTSFKYNASTEKQEILGKKNGYQFLWKEAEATVKDSIAQLTFLNKHTYYTISSLIEDRASLFLTRIGANDPNFNLRHEPALIIRKKGRDQSFANALEIHGQFDPVNEFSTNAYPSVKQMKWMQNDEAFSVLELMINEKKLMIAQSNKDFENKSKHQAGGMSWTGPVGVWYDGKKIN